MSSESVVREIAILNEALENAETEIKRLRADTLLTREEALYMIGAIQGDLTPWARSIRQKLLAFLTSNPEVFDED